MKILIRYGSSVKKSSPQWIRSHSSFVVRKVKGLAFEKRAELSLVLTGDGEVKSLNRAYRGKNKTTDVLSFPQLEGKPMARGSKGNIFLGDVVVSIPQTKRQASQQGKDFQEELALLLTHGILHLLGYDHGTKAEEKRMFGLQDRLLKKWKT